MNISVRLVQTYSLFVTIPQVFKFFIVNVEVKRIAFSASNGFLTHSNI